MSSVAVLTPESFAEHRSGLKDQEITGNILHYLLPVSTQSLQAKTFCIYISSLFMSLHLSMFFHPFFICPWMHSVVFSHPYLCPSLGGGRLCPRRWSIHPHLSGGLPSATGEGGAGREGRRASVCLGEQDQAHQSVCHHPGQPQTQSRW